jgi:outer membrane protein OmpA-like peptidoglycan-associated protein
LSPAKWPCDRLTALNAVRFAFGKSNLDQEAQGLLKENVAQLSNCPDLSGRVDTNTNHVGTDQYNHRLSERRARSVQDYYSQNGIVGSRVNTRGLGKAPEPCLEEDSGPGCRRNRRAESIPLQ